jgi:hypothetical protein
VHAHDDLVDVEVAHELFDDGGRVVADTDVRRAGEAGGVEGGPSGSAWR